MHLSCYLNAYISIYLALYRSNFIDLNIITLLPKATFGESLAIVARYWKEWSANLISMSLAVFKLNTINVCLLLYMQEVTDCKPPDWGNKLPLSQWIYSSWDFYGFAVTWTLTFPSFVWQSLHFFPDLAYPWKVYFCA